jgi:hypothetical protein
MFGTAGIPAVMSRFDELAVVLGIHERAQLLMSEGRVATTRFCEPDGTGRSQRSPLRQTGDPEDLAALQRTLGASDNDMGRLGTSHLAILSMTEKKAEGLDGVGMLVFLRHWGRSTHRARSTWSRGRPCFAI